MTMIDQLIAGSWMTAEIYALAAIVTVVGVYQIIWQFQKRAELFRVAQEATKDFYDLADDLLDDPALPENLKEIVYDIATIITRQEIGTRAIGALVDIVSDPDFSHAKPPNGITEAFESIRTHRPDLFEKVDAAFRAGIAAILLGYSHSDRRITITVLRTSKKSALLQAIQELENLLKGGNGPIAGGRRAPA